MRYDLALSLQVFSGTDALSFYQILIVIFLYKINMLIGVEIVAKLTYDL